MLNISSILVGERFRLLLLGAFVCIGLLAAVDIIADMREGTDSGHIVLEFVVFLVAIVGAMAVTLRLLREVKTSQQLVKQITLELHRNREEAREWRNETEALLQGLGASINKQFDRWGLSPAEKEIGLFLLKGLSHKEVAFIRGVSEATARQQARSIYRKAGLNGRHDLAAFFLEELALPQ